MTPVRKLTSLALLSTLLAGCAAPSSTTKAPIVPSPSATPPAAAKAGAQPAAALSPDMTQFAHEIALKDGFNEAQIDSILSHAVYKPRIIKIMNRPGEAKPWFEYRAQLINHRVVQAGADFMRAHRATLDRAARTYGVPPEIIAAILGIETRYGENKGSFRVLDSLTTLAFHYPRRADYFRSELEHYLQLARDEKINPMTLTGSFAGAIGMPQFMPSSYQRLAVDFDGDGRRDLATDADDAIGSVAHYFHEDGWIMGAPVAVPARIHGAAFHSILNQGLAPRYTRAELARYGVQPKLPVDAGTRMALFSLDGRNGPEYWLGMHNFEVISRYNNSRLYSMAVYQLSQELRQIYYKKN